TQTINRTVHFVSDGDSPQKLANDAYQTATITESTNEVTGKKQYSATITAGGVTTDAPVVVGQDGQISISFPATTIPGVNGYYVDKASASAGASTVTPADANSGRVHDGVITNETTVIYHPMGHIIPKDKSGNKIPGAETPIFTNDTKDPT